MPSSRASPDKVILGLCAQKPNLLVPHWLIASYMYYVEDNPILSDAAFDSIVKDLGDQWDTVEHRHKSLIDRGMLRSGFYLQPEDYPEIVKGAVSSLRRELVPSRRPGGGTPRVRVKRVGPSGPTPGAPNDKPGTN